MEQKNQVATQDRKPLVHLTVAALQTIRGASRFLYGVGAVCGQYLQGDDYVIAPGHDWERVTCPECIIAMDSDE